LKASPSVRKTNLQTTYYKNGLVQWLKCVTIHEALGSIPSTEKKGRETEREKEMMNESFLYSKKSLPNTGSERCCFLLKMLVSFITFKSTGHYI
jgi:hypothetical protein